MTKTRFVQLIDGTSPRHRLNRKEIKKGWHYCPGFDGGLERIVPCGCMRFGFRKKERKAQALAKKAQRKMEDYWCDQADANSY